MAGSYRGPKIHPDADRDPQRDVDHGRHREPDVGTDIASIAVSLDWDGASP